jgi:hypothetical protein
LPKNAKSPMNTGVLKAQDNGRQLSGHALHEISAVARARGGRADTADVAAGQRTEVENAQKTVD